MQFAFSAAFQALMDGLKIQGVGITQELVIE